MFTVQNDCLAWLLFSLCFSGNHRSTLKSIGEEVSLSHQIGSESIKCFIKITTQLIELEHHDRLRKKAFMYSFLSYQFDVILEYIPYIKSHPSKFM